MCDHLKAIQKISDQHTWKARHQETKENNHAGHCTHTSESTKVKFEQRHHVVLINVI